MALDLGLSDAEIAQADSTTLQATVYHLNRQALELARQGSHAATLQSATDRSLASTNRQATPGEGRANVEQPSGGDSVAPADDSFDVDEAKGYDPQVVKMAKAISKLLADNKELKSRLDEPHTDTAVPGGESDQDARIASGPKHQVRRHAVLTYETLDVQAFLPLVDTWSKQPGTLEEKIHKALGLLYGTEPVQAAPAASREAAWKNGAVARPTQRGNAAEPPGERKALQTAARVMKEQGIGDDDLPEDAFPD
jgi:hypothetical protein